MAGDRWLYGWALGSVALGGASLLVPLYVVELGGGAVALGLLAASAALAGVPGALVVGRLADRTGRRREYVVAGLALVALTLAALPLFESIALVVAANAVVWFAAAAMGPVLTLLATVGAPEREWPARFAVLNRYGGWGWAAGLLLGAGWTGAGATLADPLTAQRTFFLACGAAAGLATLGVTRWLPREVPRRSPRRLALALRRAGRLNVRTATFPYTPGRLYWTTRSLSPRRFVSRFTPALSLYFCAAVAFFAGFAAFFAPLPLFLVEAVGFGSDAVFALYLVSSVGAAAFYVGAGRLAGRFDLAALQAAGLGVRAVTIPAIAVLGTAVGAGLAGLGAVGVAFVLLGVSWAVIAVTATTLVTRLAPAAMRGEVLGVYSALVALAGGIGSVVGGRLAAASFTTAFVAAGALVSLGAALVVLLRVLRGSVRTEETPGGGPAVESAE